MTQPIFNQDNFLQSLASDKELADELLAAFMEDSPARSTSLGEALDEGDGSGVSRMAHSLKGMCGVVRAEELVGLSLSMENAAKGGDLGRVRELHDTFKDKLAMAHIEMKGFISD